MKLIDKKTKTIAVLPFVNMSADPDNEYFSDGMTEEIINALAKIKELKVTSRTSSFFFKNKNIPIAQIGAALNVSTILEGSTRLSGSMMRITAQLIDVEDDVHFWSETFDRSVDDIFAVQDEISLLIADKLREHIGHFNIEDQLVEAPNIPIEAYKHYLQSRYHILKMRKKDIEQGISILQQLLQTQRHFALAHLGMHLAYTLQGVMGFVTPQEAFINGKTHLEKAIELDENLPECQLHLSYDTFMQQWDMPATYQHLNKSFEMRPSVEYYQSMVSVLSAEQKFEAAQNYIETALQLDPFSEINHHLQGFIYYAQENYDQAIPYFKKAIELKPSFVVSSFYWGQSLLLTNEAQEALNLFQHLPEDEAGDITKLGFLTLAHAVLGNTTATTEGIAKLLPALETDSISKAINALVLCYAVLDQKEKAIQQLELALSTRMPMMVYLLTEPLLKPLRSNARFQEITKTVLGTQTSFSSAKRKYKKALLNKEELSQYQKQLERLMQEQQLYLNPDLTLRDLAQSLSIPPNYLSQLLNEGFRKNFSEYVNSYRLEVFKSKLKDKNNQQLTILGLAYESGFNSKTVFNTFFKKMMGKTPKAYWKELQY